jgi:hypothetical protein
MTNRLKVIVALSLAAALTLGATLAFAFGENGLIRACVNNASGSPKIVGAGATCGPNETLLEWNTAGSSGATNSTIFAMRGLVVLYGPGVCTNFLGDNNACGYPFDDFNAPLPRAGRLTTLAIHPFFNTLDAPATITVYVNNAPTSLSVTIPSGSPDTVIVEGSVPIAAGDLVKIVGNGPAEPVTDTRLDYNGTLLYEYP